ncbi:MAG TPA: hypothetical protein VG318_01190 [Actinomycetota bacterium]|nr:hypothetical protein [Actinomycetota bacterium]
MTGPRDPAELDEARRHLGLTLKDLWIRYFALGGNADQIELDAFFHGLSELSRLEYNVLAHAINEAFMDHGAERRVPYYFEDGSGPR